MATALERFKAATGNVLADPFKCHCPFFSAETYPTLGCQFDHKHKLGMNLPGFHVSLPSLWADQRTVFA